jgi:single-strand DNA-binding protein
MNHIMLIGNVTGGVDLVTTSGGTDVANFSIAVTKYKDKKSEKWIADYFDCVAWKDLAVNISQSIKKGTRVIISGKIENQNWEDDEGTKRKNTRITVFNLGVDLSFAVCTGIRTSKKINKEPEDTDILSSDGEFTDKEVSRFTAS